MLANKHTIQNIYLRSLSQDPSIQIKSKPTKYSVTNLKNF